MSRRWDRNTHNPRQRSDQHHCHNYVPNSNSSALQPGWRSQRFLNPAPHDLSILIVQRMNERETGAAIVEMAFVTILLALLVCGVADLGRAVFTNIGVHDAAQEGARY